MIQRKSYIHIPNQTSLMIICTIANLGFLRSLKLILWKKKMTTKTLERFSKDSSPKSQEDAKEIFIISYTKILSKPSL